MEEEGAVPKKARMKGGEHSEIIRRKACRLLERRRKSGVAINLKIEFRTISQFLREVQLPEVPALGKNRMSFIRIRKGVLKASC